MSTLNVDTLQDKAGAFEHARLVQVVNTETGAVATGTTVLPNDDTIPQNDEGNEFMTLAITPTHASNKLLIQVTIILASSVNGSRVGAPLFQDSTAGALATAGSYASNKADTFSDITYSHYMTAGTTSSTTFKVRGGVEDSATVTMNGEGGTRTHGGIMASSITISEIRV